LTNFIVRLLSQNILQSIHSINLSRWKKPIAVGLIAFFVGIQGFVFYVRYCTLSDWTVHFSPAAQDLFNKDLYCSERYGFYNPLWVLFFIYPFSFLPVRVGNLLVSLLCLVGLAWVAYRRGAKPLDMALFLLMPQVQFMAGNGDFVDVLTSIGFVLPPQIGLFFILAKPQAGVGLALYWFVLVWQKGKLKEVIRIFAPVLIAYMVLLLAYKPNLLQALLAAKDQVGMGSAHDVNMWPYGVIFGVLLLVSAIKKRDNGRAILSSVCFMPYVGFYTWPVALLGLLPSKLYFRLAVITMWILGLILGHS